MAKRDGIVIVAGAVGAGLLLSRMQDDSGDGNGDGGGGDPQPTCSDQVDSAQAYADGKQCTDDQFIMACPMGDVQYTAVNTCERNWLQNQGWTVEGKPGSDDPPDDEPPVPDPVDYTVQVLSDSPTEVQYTIHTGTRPVALGPPDVERRYQAETTRTVESQYVSETIQQLSDGTWRIDGSTGSGDGTVYGDSFAWTTTDHEMYGFLGWEANLGSDAYSIEVNGQEIDPTALPLLEL